MLRLVVVAFAALSLAACGLSSPAVQEAPWKVTQRDGLVQVEQAGQPVRDLLPGEVLTYGAVVTTGADSSAKIANGLQTMMMAANSRLAIPAGREGGMTAILQSMGSVLFQVDHRQAAHFRVETPLLTAIVKGTTFRIDMNSAGATIAVSNGLVEVRAAEGEAHRDVPAGSAARVAAAAPQAVVMVSRDEQLRASVTPAGASGPGVPAGASPSGAASAESATSSSAQKAKEGPSSVGQMQGSVWVIVGYAAVALVAWVALVFLFLVGRALLRSVKARPPIRPRID